MSGSKGKSEVQRKGRLSLLDDVREVCPRPEEQHWGKTEAESIQSETISELP